MRIVASLTVCKLSVILVHVSRLFLYRILGGGGGGSAQTDLSCGYLGDRE